MNERLEEQLIVWHKEHFKETGTYEQHSGFYLANSSQLSIAKHFYNLALEDVKKEIEEDFTALDGLLKQDMLNEYGKGRHDCMEQIKDFIEKQKA